MAQPEEPSDWTWTAVAERAKDLLFFVEFAPKPEMIPQLRSLADRLRTVPKAADRAKAVRRGFSCTGFVHLAGPMGPFIMTTAHGFQHLYRAGSDPLTADTFNMYDVRVVCDHQEEQYQAAGILEDNSKYATARLVGVECSKDVLLLAVQSKDLKNLVDDSVCDRPHPALTFAQARPRAGRRWMHDAVMAGASAQDPHHRVDKLLPSREPLQRAQLAPV